jgi:hypothetical protein
MDVIVKGGKVQFPQFTKPHNKIYQSPDRKFIKISTQTTCQHSSFYFPDMGILPSFHHASRFLWKTIIKNNLNNIM